MNPFFVGIAIAWMAFGIWKAAQAAVAMHKLATEATEVLK